MHIKNKTVLQRCILIGYIATSNVPWNRNTDLVNVNDPAKDWHQLNYNLLSHFGEEKLIANIIDIDGRVIVDITIDFE